MLDTVLSGILIGICVSAPLGPVGVLCIQRTLSRGRAHGFFTGLGATVSDLIYAIITGFGMSFIMPVINSNRTLIQILGCVIICLFEIHIFRSRPVAHISNSGQSSAKNTYMRDFVTSFALCFSNPLIIFLFIGLFAHFNFVIQGESMEDMVNSVVGFFSIMLGALIWWFSLTLLVGKLRSRFSLNTIWTINKVIGSVLILLCVTGVILTLMGITF